MIRNYLRGRSRQSIRENRLTSAPEGAYVSYADADPRQIFNVLVGPNGIRHSYSTTDDSAEFTKTPYREFCGNDIGSIFGFAPMDTTTLELYEAVHALDKTVSSISIFPQELTLDAFEQTDRNGYLYGEWPEDVDRQVVSLLASHLGFTDATYRVRKQSSHELHIILDDTVRQFEQENPLLASGWTFTT